jgi:Predicted Peptidoglycan domain
MPDKRTATLRILGFEDPDWGSAVSGGKPEPDDVVTGQVDGYGKPIVIKAWARFGVNSYYNPKVPAEFFAGMMPYTQALELAISIYENEYITDALMGLTDQGVFNVAADMQVNPGSGAGSRIFQASCNDCGGALTVDGEIGPLTIAAANGCDPAKLITSIQQNRWTYYQGRPSFAANQAAWRQRTFAP